MHGVVARKSHAQNEPGPKLRNGSEMIRVRLLPLAQAMIQARGPSLTLSLAKRPELGSLQSPEWLIDCKRGNVIHPKTGNSRKIPSSGVLLESASGAVELNGNRYRDQLVIYPQTKATGGFCQVVNHLPLEKYLESVVNSEFNSQWSESAVEAQVIAARTYALYQKNESRKTPSKLFDVESTVKDQMYLGLDKVDSLAVRAVTRTKGMILSATNSKVPVKAFYHSTCGGNTLLPQDVWAGTRVSGFQKRARCGYCSRSPVSNWTFQSKLSDLQVKLEPGLLGDASLKQKVQNNSLFASFYQSPKSWQLRGISTEPNQKMKKEFRIIPQAMAESGAAHTINGRAKRFYLNYINKMNPGLSLEIPVDAYQARNWIDPTRLKSTWVELKVSGEWVKFEGKGSGHGVGLCQYGAKAMGERGFSREQILSQYYPGLKLTKIW